MLRPVTLLVLLCVSVATLAQPLYKWVEKDGSITFSVEPPPAGVSFETIENKTSNKISSPSKPQSTRQNSVEQSLVEQSLVEQSLVEQRIGTQNPQLVAPIQGLQATTRQSLQNNARGQNFSAQSQSAASGESANIPNQDTQAAIRASTRKEQQCDDLKKRVISLERRLQTRLTPDDMDNTVVHMVRYQRSFDHHCVQ